MEGFRWSLELKGGLLGFFWGFLVLSFCHSWGTGLALLCIHDISVSNLVNTWRKCELQGTP